MLERSGDHQAALTLLRRILNHVAKNQQLGYEFLKGIAITMGVRLSNYKAQMAFGILTKELIVKAKNYSRCAGWSIATLYEVTDRVQFVREDDEAQGETSQDENGRRTRSSSNYTISRFSTNEALYEPLDMDEIAAEVSRLRTEKTFRDRIRASRKRSIDS